MGLVSLQPMQRGMDFHAEEVLQGVAPMPSAQTMGQPGTVSQCRLHSELPGTCSAASACVVLTSWCAVARAAAAAARPSASCACTPGLPTLYPVLWHFRYSTNTAVVRTHAVNRTACISAHFHTNLAAPLHPQIP